jgi:hypothetical protein
MAAKFKANKPCPCGSGKKYKYCCLPLNEEIRKQIKVLDSEEFVTTCVNCGKKINPNSEIFTLGAKVSPGIDLSPFMGRMINLPSFRKDIFPVIVSGKDSDAIKAGNDLLMTVCSENCGNELKEYIRREKEILFGFTFN